MNKDIIRSPFGRYFQFGLVFIVLFLIVGVQNYLDLRPQSIHIWRQTDCLSITQNYYQNNTPFLEPEIYNQLSDGGTTGKSIGEFTGLYYLVAQLWKIFGKHEWIYRLLGFTIFASGLVFLFKLAYKESKSIVFSTFIGLLLFTSPTIVFYSVSFLTNVPALALVLAGWWFFYKYNESSKLYFLWISAFIFALAISLKTTAGISYVAILGWWGIEFLFFRKNKIIFKEPFKEIIPLVAAIIPVIAWYWYADVYNNIHQGKYTFNSIWPLWEMSSEKLHDTITAVQKIWLKEYFHGSLLIISGVLWLIMIVQPKKVGWFYYYLLLIIPFGSILYLILWFQALQSHDYYLINIFINVVLVFFVFMKSFGGSRFLQHPVFKSVLLIYLLFLGYNCSIRMNDRFDGSKNNPYRNQYQAIGELEPILDSLGIGKDDIVISVPDRAINSSLYLMNRKGFTEYGRRFDTEEQYYKCIDLGAKYLIVSDTAFLSKEVIQPFIGAELMKYKNVTIYDLQNIAIPEKEK